MKLGIFAKTYVRPNLAETLRAAVADGLFVVQFNFACVGLPTLPEAIPDSLIAEIREWRDRLGLTLAAVSGTFNLIHPDLRQRNNGLRRLPVLADACRQLEIPTITLCSGTRDPVDMWRGHPDNRTESAWSELRSSLDQALADTEAFGVTLAFEPEASNVISSATAGRRLLEELSHPRIGVVMDPANLLHPGDQPRQADILRAAFDDLGHRIVLAHAKELNEAMRPDGRGPGRGVIDWSEYFRCLREAGFSGAVVMHGLDEAEVPPAAFFLRTLL